VQFNKAAVKTFWHSPLEIIRKTWRMQKQF